MHYFITDATGSSLFAQFSQNRESFVSSYLFLFSFSYLSYIKHTSQFLKLKTKNNNTITTTASKMRHLKWLFCEKVFDTASNILVQNLFLGITSRKKYS